MQLQSDQHDYPKLISTRRSKHDNKAKNLAFGALAAFVILYVGFRDPLLLCALSAAALIASSVWFVGHSIPALERQLRTRFKFWHVLTAIFAVGIFLDLSTPAHAVFLGGLETFVTNVVTDTAAASGGEGIPEDVVHLVFNLFRIAFLLLVVAASLYAYNQAQQGNDWRPIVTQVSIAIAIVIAVDVLTALFYDEGGAGAMLPSIGNNVALISNGIHSAVHHGISLLSQIA